MPSSTAVQSADNSVCSSQERSSSLNGSIPPPSPYEVSHDELLVLEDMTSVPHHIFHSLRRSQEEPLTKTNLTPSLLPITYECTAASLSSHNALFLLLPLSGKEPLTLNLPQENNNVSQDNTTSHNSTLSLLTSHSDSDSRHQRSNSTHRQLGSSCCDNCAHETVIKIVTPSCIKEENTHQQARKKQKKKQRMPCHSDLVIAATTSNGDGDNTLGWGKDKTGYSGKGVDVMRESLSLSSLKEKNKDKGQMGHSLSYKGKEGTEVTITKEEAREGLSSSEGSQNLKVSEMERDTLSYKRDTQQTRNNNNNKSMIDMCAIINSPHEKFMGLVNDCYGEDSDLSLVQIASEMKTCTRQSKSASDCNTNKLNNSTLNGIYTGGNCTGCSPVFQSPAAIESLGLFFPHYDYKKQQQQQEQLQFSLLNTSSNYNANPESFRTTTISQIETTSSPNSPRLCHNNKETISTHENARERFDLSVHSSPGKITQITPILTTAHLWDASSENEEGKVGSSSSSNPHSFNEQRGIHHGSSSTSTLIGVKNKQRRERGSKCDGDPTSIFPQPTDQKNIYHPLRQISSSFPTLAFSPFSMIQHDRESTVNTSTTENRGFSRSSEGSTSWNCAKSFTISAGTSLQTSRLNSTQQSILGGISPANSDILKDYTVDGMHSDGTGRKDGRLSPAGFGIWATGNSTRDSLQRSIGAMGYENHSNGMSPYHYYYNRGNAWSGSGDSMQSSMRSQRDNAVGDNSRKELRYRVHRGYNALRLHLRNKGIPITVRSRILKGNLLGNGGYARVYVGLNVATNEIVAIKETLMSSTKDVIAFRIIEDEFKSIWKLRHENIVRYSFFEYSFSQKVCRIILEFCSGGSMLGILQRYGRIPENILKTIIRDVIQGLIFIHNKGIIHSDIKPANILINAYAVSKLADFGSSRQINQVNAHTNYLLGTPVYMSPETIKGQMGLRSDIWSLGCTMFELSTGLTPWYYTGMKDHLQLMFYITATSETPLKLPKDYDVEFSPQFEDFICRCLDRLPDRRPSAEELLKHPWLVNISAADVEGKKQLEIMSAQTCCESCAILTNEYNSFSSSNGNFSKATLLHRTAPDSATVISSQLNGEGSRSRSATPALSSFAATVGITTHRSSTTCITSPAYAGKNSGSFWVPQALKSNSFSAINTQCGSDAKVAQTTGCFFNSFTGEPTTREMEENKTTGKKNNIDMNSTRVKKHEGMDGGVPSALKSSENGFSVSCLRRTDADTPALKSSSVSDLLNATVTEGVMKTSDGLLQKSVDNVMGASITSFISNVGSDSGGRISATPKDERKGTHFDHDDIADNLIESQQLSDEGVYEHRGRPTTEGESSDMPYCQPQEEVAFVNAYTHNGEKDDLNSDKILLDLEFPKHEFVLLPLSSSNASFIARSVHSNDDKKKELKELITSQFGDDQATHFATRTAFVASSDEKSPSFITRDTVRSLEVKGGRCLGNDDFVTSAETAYSSQTFAAPPLASVANIASRDDIEYHYTTICTDDEPQDNIKTDQSYMNGLEGEKGILISLLNGDEGDAQSCTSSASNFRSLASSSVETQAPLFISSTGDERDPFHDGDGYERGEGIEMEEPYEGQGKQQIDGSFEVQASDDIAVAAVKADKKVVKNSNFLNKESAMATLVYRKEERSFPSMEASQNAVFSMKNVSTISDRSCRLSVVDNSQCPYSAKDNIVLLMHREMPDEMERVASLEDTGLLDMPHVCHVSESKLISSKSEEEKVISSFNKSLGGKFIGTSPTAALSNSAAARARSRKNHFSGCCSPYLQGLGTNMSTSETANSSSMGEALVDFHWISPSPHRGLGRVTSGVFPSPSMSVNLSLLCYSDFGVPSSGFVISSKPSPLIQDIKSVMGEDGMTIVDKNTARDRSLTGRVMHHSSRSLGAVLSGGAVTPDTRGSEQLVSQAHLFQESQQFLIIVERENGSLGLISKEIVDFSIQVAAEHASLQDLGVTFPAAVSTEVAMGRSNQLSLQPLQCTRNSISCSQPGTSQGISLVNGFSCSSAAPSINRSRCTTPLFTCVKTGEIHHTKRSRQRSQSQQPRIRHSFNAEMKIMRNVFESHVEHDESILSSHTLVENINGMSLPDTSGTSLPRNSSITSSQGVTKEGPEGGGRGDRQPAALSHLHYPAMSLLEEESYIIGSNNEGYFNNDYNNSNHNNPTLWDADVRAELERIETKLFLCLSSHRQRSPARRRSHCASFFGENAAPVENSKANVNPLRKKEIDETNRDEDVYLPHLHHRGSNQSSTSLFFGSPHVSVSSLHRLRVSVDHSSSDHLNGNSKINPTHESTNPQAFSRGDTVASPLIIVGGDASGLSDHDVVTLPEFSLCARQDYGHQRGNLVRFVFVPDFIPFLRPSDTSSIRSTGKLNIEERRCFGGQIGTKSAGGDVGDGCLMNELDTLVMSVSDVGDKISISSHRRMSSITQISGTDVKSHPASVSSVSEHCGKLLSVSNQGIDNAESLRSHERSQSHSDQSYAFYSTHNHFASASAAAVATASAITINEKPVATCNPTYPVKRGFLWEESHFLFPTSPLPSTSVMISPKTNSFGEVAAASNAPHIHKNSNHNNHFEPTAEPGIEILLYLKYKDVCIKVINGRPTFVLKMSNNIYKQLRQNIIGYVEGASQGRESHQDGVETVGSSVYKGNDSTTRESNKRLNSRERDELIMNIGHGSHSVSGTPTFLLPSFMGRENSAIEGSTMNIINHKNNIKIREECFFNHSDVLCVSCQNAAVTSFFPVVSSLSHHTVGTVGDNFPFILNRSKGQTSQHAPQMERQQQIYQLSGRQQTCSKCNSAILETLQSHHFNINRDVEENVHNGSDELLDDSHDNNGNFSYSRSDRRDKVESVIDEYQKKAKRKTTIKIKSAHDIKNCHWKVSRNRKGSFKTLEDISKEHILGNKESEYVGNKEKVKQKSYSPQQFCKVKKLLFASNDMMRGTGPQEVFPQTACQYPPQEKSIQRRDYYNINNCNSTCTHEPPLLPPSLSRIPHLSKRQGRSGNGGDECTVYDNSTVTESSSPSQETERPSLPFKDSDFLMRDYEFPLHDPFDMGEIDDEDESVKEEDGDEGTVAAFELLKKSSGGYKDYKERKLKDDTNANNCSYYHHDKGKKTVVSTRYAGAFGVGQEGYGSAFSSSSGGNHVHSGILAMSPQLNSSIGSSTSIWNSGAFLSPRFPLGSGSPGALNLGRLSTPVMRSSSKTAAAGGANCGSWGILPVSSASFATSKGWGMGGLQPSHSMEWGSKSNLGRGAPLEKIERWYMSGLSVVGGMGNEASVSPRLNSVSETTSVVSTSNTGACLRFPRINISRSSSSIFASPVISPNRIRAGSH